MPPRLEKAAFYARRNFLNTHAGKPLSRGDLYKWHLWLGHPGTTEASRGFSSGDGSEKAARQKRRDKDHSPTQAGVRLRVDFHEYDDPRTCSDQDWQVKLVTDRYSGYTWDYYTNNKDADVIKTSLTDLIRHLQVHHDVKAAVIEWDRELTGTQSVTSDLSDSLSNTYGIQCQWSPFNTQGLNGVTRYVRFNGDDILSGNIKTLTEGVLSVTINWEKHMNQIQHQLLSQADTELTRSTDDEYIFTPVPEPFELKESADQTDDESDSAGSLPSTPIGSNRLYTETRFELFPGPPPSLEACALFSATIAGGELEPKVAAPPTQASYHSRGVTKLTPQDSYPKASFNTWPYALRVAPTKEVDADKVARLQIVADKLRDEVDVVAPHDKERLSRLLAQRKLPKWTGDLANHPMKTPFREAEELHLKKHREMGTWREVSKSTARNHMVLDCMWQRGDQQLTGGTNDTNMLILLEPSLRTLAPILAILDVQGSSITPASTA
ncbi:hypothetical protein GGR51DRAFT_560886 [Nemania sp. FL0031]|nr:hypothetical protein GGR51DRAFT_560886 [Nemania sp. FL0031]